MLSKLGAFKLITLKCQNSTKTQLLNSTESIKERPSTLSLKNLLHLMCALEWNLPPMALLLDGETLSDLQTRRLPKLKSHNPSELSLELMAPRTQYMEVTLENQLREKLNSFSEESLLTE